MKRNASWYVYTLRLLKKPGRALCGPQHWNLTLHTLYLRNFWDISGVELISRLLLPYKYEIHPDSHCPRPTGCVYAMLWRAFVEATCLSFSLMETLTLHPRPFPVMVAPIQATRSSER